MSAPMVRAILAGTKTQTRRVVKPASGYAWLDIDAGTMINNGGHKKHISDLRAPYGQPGDQLWVRETWAYGIHALAAKRDEQGPFVYAADGTTQGRLCDRWRPSIHMPRWASRILLEVTAVRVERLRDISEADAKAEGIEPFTDFQPSGHWRRYDKGTFNSYVSSPVDSYASLWEQINGPGSWDANPWVWVVEFKQVTP